MKKQICILTKSLKDHDYCVAGIDINTGNADNFWSATGTLGGGDDPNVPEPTALALLALGVAGVALRRRVA